MNRCYGIIHSFEREPERDVDRPSISFRSIPCTLFLASFLFVSSSIDIYISKSVEIF